MHLTDLMDQAGVKENALGDRGLAGVDVRGDADVARPLQRDTRGSANSDSSKLVSVSNSRSAPIT